MAELLPLWVSVHTRKVLKPFVSTLARSHKWNTLYLISPWISKFDIDAGMSYGQLLKRLIDDDATAYVVTRPPEEEWHANAVSALVATGQANIKFVDSLHTKLYGAKTAQGEFALVGSANFTQRSLDNREVAVLVRSINEGQSVVKTLIAEAASIYRMPGARTHYLRKLSRG